jgi:hypothetical protein
MADPNLDASDRSLPTSHSVATMPMGVPSTSDLTSVTRRPLADPVPVVDTSFYSPIFVGDNHILHSLLHHTSN